MRIIYDFVHSKPVIPEKVKVKSCEVKIPRVFVCDTCDKYGFSQSKLKSHVCKVTNTVTSDNDLESHTVMPPDDFPNSFSDETIVHEGLKERNMEENTETIDDSKENIPLNTISINISQTQQNDSEENDNIDDDDKPWEPRVEIGISKFKRQKVTHLVHY